MILAQFCGALTTDAVNPTSNFCANPGSAIASAALGPQRFPTSRRLITKMRAVWNTGAIPTVTPVVLTLMKNGVATAMSISIPSNTAQFKKFADVDHPVFFEDGDDFDINATNAGGVNGNALFTVTLEGG